MVDIDPYQTINTHAPRETNLVDAVAATRRIADQQMRSNPLKDARIDSGLTRWVGNYGVSLVWIGEITPLDQNLTDAYGNLKRQRALVVQRDDPGGHFALTMYDPSPSPGVPLQQILTLSDVNGKRMYQDSSDGGLAFPDRPIPLYPRTSIDPGLTNTVDDVVWSGSGNITGSQVQFFGGWAVGGTVTVTTFVRVTGVGGTVVNSPTLVLAGANSMAQTIDISAIFDNGEDFIDVEWHIFRSAGTGTYYPRPYRCRNYSP